MQPAYPNCLHHLYTVSIALQHISPVTILWALSLFFFSSIGHLTTLDRHRQSAMPELCAYATLAYAMHCENNKRDT